MTHKPDISKYLWLSTDSRWKYTTSHRLVVLFIFIASILPAPNLCGQNIAIKSNLLYDLTTSLNLGGEIRCDDTHTLSLSVNYNPWSFGNNKKIKHFLIQPEYRKWFNEAFAGSFIGLQFHYGLFNSGGIFPSANNRYQGNLAGFGISSGYQWMISPQWNLEAGISLGYAHLNYKRYGQPAGAPLIEKSSYNYWGPTQIGISVVYFIQ
ncbi:DUF3575 domain-containing protein [Bacteroides sp. f07]|jgi:outer membrane receptor protein involved in Fe transport|uniref:DUF3575 domain-containing protein n=1 Tax=Bacteroides sp. f07 TaxID=3132704 RepID=UPI00280B4A60|nr:DUF3575 domain-containing protein [uncultured Bacteroides sp.]